MPNTIAFADLTHTGKKIDATFMPFAVACIAAKMKKRFGDDVRVDLFKYPQDLASFVERQAPRIAAFSNYCWNEDLSIKMAEAIKKRSPETVTVLGGPNCPYAFDELTAYLSARPSVDFYIVGEGEDAFIDLYEALRDADFSAEKIIKSRREISNTRYLSDGGLVAGPMLPRMSDLDSIPSPYLSGLMDKFFDGTLTPMVQNARGCPYSCTFCHDGLDYMSKYQRFSKGRIEAEIDFIKSQNISPALCIVDDNFGIHKDDLAVAQKIGAVRKETGWPNFISYGGTAKNNKERIIEISKAIGNAIEAGASVQSTDPHVLESIRRSNISTATVASMARKVAEQGVTSFTEIILCLPGDSKEKHIKSICEMMDLDIQDFRLFQFVVLPGTEGASPEHRKRFGYVTAWRVFPRCYGHYEIGGDRFSSAEISEVCVANNTMSPEDYLECRKFDLTVGIFFNGGVYEELFHFLKHRNIRRSEFLAQIFQHARDRSPAMRKIYDWFEEDEKRSFFPTADSLRAFLAKPDTVDRYISGELGINQMMQSRAMALSESFADTTRLAFDVARELLKTHGKLGPESELYLAELHELLVLRKGDVFSIQPPSEKTFHFDFPNLAKSGFLTDPYDHMVPDGMAVKVDHSAIKKNDVGKYVKQFGGSIDGMSHFLQRSAIRSIYRDVLSADAEA